MKRSIIRLPRLTLLLLLLAASVLLSAMMTHSRQTSEHLLSPQPVQRTDSVDASLFKCAGQPLELVKPEILRHKVFEPILIMGAQKVKNLDIRLRVKGGGHVSQVYGK